ncbi:MAG TPA: cytochrome c peroxidase [Anaeromyxobacter sp.]|nr:cytochrome c peroxidase [Anaeromyxobacter sp.]
MTSGNSSFRRLPFALLLAGVVSCGPEKSEDPPLSANAQPLVGQTYTLTCQAPGTGFGEVVIPPVPGTLPFTPLMSLKTVPNPVLEIDAKTGAWVAGGGLANYVVDTTALIQLGKALFWDVQAGSDDLVSCASCHFQAGADIRATNQLHPGANGAWDGQAANQTLAAIDFPFTDPAIPRDIDNAAGSQGVRRGAFVAVDPTTGVETVTYQNDPVFGNARQATGLNAPPSVNAVFNHRNFYNGRAQPEFNGVNPWGTRDSAARIWYVFNAAGDIAQSTARIQNGSLASQAVGPPLNPTEMSAVGRTFPDLGRKLLRRKPLGLQKVAADDSVLGAIADRRLKGLKTTYAAMIQKAFVPSLWNTAKTVTIGTTSYSLLEANFSLFWGISIMAYEATLVSDDSPMDRYAASRVFETATGTGQLISHSPALLQPVVDRLAAEGIAITIADILTGLDLFEKPLPLPGTGLPIQPGTGVGCVFCHVGAETTSASIRALTGHGLEPGDVALKNAGFDLRMERMFMGFKPPPPVPPHPAPPVPVGTDVITFDSGTYAVNAISINNTPVTPTPVRIATYDSGWYNIGVRPTAEDLGLGGLDLLGRPLSWVEYYLATLPDPSVIRVVGGGLGCTDAFGNPVTPPAAPVTSPFAGEVLNPATGYPLLAGGLLRGEATDVAGSFKTASLRNVELTGPYLHNGGKSTLWQVMELYDDGGNFQNPTLSPLIRPIGMTPAQVKALVAFLVSLTDERVLYERAPFDHPELVVPVGQDATGKDLLTTLPAVGAAGSVKLRRFLDLSPFQP